MTQDEALALLKTGASVFLTGRPGSGKTHTVNRYLEDLAEAGIPYAYTASTGIAATHGHGVTIHAWSGVGVKNALTRRDLDTIASNRRLAARIEKTKVLVIDEVSMLPARTLTLADTVCRHVRATNAPFGGIQVVLVGDFFQLPPVVRRQSNDGMLQFGGDGDESDAGFAHGSAPGGISIPRSAICRNSTARTTSPFSTFSMRSAATPAQALTGSALPRALSPTTRCRPPGRGCSPTMRPWTTSTGSNSASSRANRASLP
ncbi:hypothetical protein AUC68_07380 [Methyloceanibacter methanicus]|uniref:AAA+ ATPase domain-containing protein n=1 Tax=Methyloceanibacter methanicus TaxID=1774968 RepID=A0A1E3W0D2_9HYPH|nr:AAA family ATPase [Methyloceanibacter methanicus]ODR98971.1 hypothetical protein AUC68_07380 [Methyloceanibacter methanicus]